MSRLAAVIAVLGLAALFLWQTPWLQKLLYPLPHKELIFQYAQKNSVDPYLVAAIIRNESKFLPQAESSVGAKGLMQLMPETAEWIAQSMGMADYRQEKLYEPATNIQMGCWYLGNLQKEFGGRTHLVIAAYNGGRGNVQEWLKTRQWSGKLEAIDQIPFQETRQYVKKVMQDYQRYHQIYAQS